MSSPLVSLNLPHFSQDKSSVTYSTLARAAKNAVKQGRAARNSLYKQVQFINSLPKDAKVYHKENDQAQGLPRAFSIRFTDHTVDQDHPELQKLSGQTLVIGEHGSNDTGMYLNGHEIHPDDTTFSAATNSYSFKTSLQVAQAATKTSAGAFFSLMGAQPSGVLAVGDKTFNIHLDPAKVWFDVNISANAGAYFSSGDKKLKWDTNSSQWTSASWETAGLTFGYDTKNIGDFLQPRWVAENTFVDNSSNPPTEFDLAATPMTYPSQYTSTMSPSDATGSSMLTQVVIQPPAAPASRADKPVASVFPTIWQVQFSPFGNSFDGAYQDAKGNVYAVSGMVKMDDSTSIVDMLSVASENLPVQNVNPAAEAASMGIEATEAKVANGTASENAVAQADVHAIEQPAVSMMMAAPQPVFSSLVAANTGGTGAPPLQVFELLNLNPMVQDSTDPSGWRDSVAQLAMTDFHDLIVYFMDPDLRTTFVQASAPALTPALLAIANDDAASGTGENKAFYQKLQVPFIVSMLAAGTLDQGKYCNGKRADARLKDIPSDDPVYKRHSSKLYRAHFIEQFPSITKFLRDQSQNDYTAKMNAFATSMKNNITAKSAGLKDPVGNPNYDAQLAAAQKDIDDLIVWAKERSLFWALQLLYYVQNSALPNWYSQYTSGSNTSNLSMMQKQLNALFGLLENNQTNTKPGGRNFMQAYNDDMRLFQMTSIIPTLIDARGNSREIDNLVVECLLDYIEHFKASPDQNHVDAVAAAEQLSASKKLRDLFWIPLATASRLGVAGSSWQLTMSMWENTIRDAAWFKNMAKGGKLLFVFEAAAAAAFILLPLLPSIWDQMSESQKLSWKLSIAGLCGMLVLRIIQGSIRFFYFGGDIAGFLPSLKCILGFESVIDAIPVAAERLQGSWAKFFTRTSKQTLQIQEREAWFRSELIAENEYSEFSTVERMMGRNMGEVIGTIAGLALAAVSIVMTAIDLADQEEGALIAMDIMMLISSIVQILAVVAGWITIAGTAAEAGAFLATLASYSAVSFCATWGGPVAIIFAIIGIIIFLIWLYNQDHRDPIDKFLDDQAGPAGLRMPGPKQAPEYFGVVPADETNPSLVGLDIRGPLVSVQKYQVFPAEGQVVFTKPDQPPIFEDDTLKIPDVQQQFLSLDVTNKAPALVDKIDYSMNTVWSLETDPDGKSMIYTASFTQEKDKDGNTVTKRTLWYLGTSDDNSQVVYRQLPPESDITARNPVLPHVQWTIDVLTQPTQDAPDVKNEDGIVTKPGKVLSAIVGISQNGARLGRWADRKTLKLDAGVALATDDKAVTGSKTFPDNMLCATWTVNMAPIGPSDFQYILPTWKIYDTDTDLRNAPRFLLPSTQSEGLQWTIDPTLPDGVFELVKTAGQDEGIIRQVAGKKAPQMAAKTYAVSCSLMVNGVASGTRTTKVTIEVIHDTGDV